jgi:hypothetical protein
VGAEPIYAVGRTHRQTDEHKKIDCSFFANMRKRLKNSFANPSHEVTLSGNADTLQSVLNLGTISRYKVVQI